MIELTPEWVLNELPDSLYANGKGKGEVFTEDIVSSRWIKLALNTLDIPFIEEEYYDDKDVWTSAFEFQIEDIKEECPSFYKRMKEMDLWNSKFLYNQIN